MISNEIRNILINTKDRLIDNLGFHRYYLKYKEVVLTCYFNSKKDPQRNIKIDNDSYEYIKPWYETMKKQNLHGIIFYDNLSSNFISKYQTEKIIFIKSNIGKYSINDERYILWYKFILYNPYNYILMTDVSDVFINRDPFIFMKEVVNNNKLCIGTNVVGKGALKRTPEWFDRRKWKIDKFNEVLNNAGLDVNGFLKNNFQIYNPGLLGGNRNICLNFLHKLNFIHLQCPEKYNFNMVTVNYLIHTFLMKGYKSGGLAYNKSEKENYNTDYIVSGYPFNSLFTKNEILGESECYLIHK
tara:strand:- start:417 stop:1313 length:897 start_codon:yes stop_codon:yes gene_type:complete